MEHILIKFGTNVMALVAIPHFRILIHNILSNGYGGGG